MWKISGPKIRTNQGISVLKHNEHNRIFNLPSSTLTFSKLNSGSFIGHNGGTITLGLVVMMKMKAKIKFMDLLEFLLSKFFLSLRFE